MRIKSKTFVTYGMAITFIVVLVAILVLVLNVARDGALAGKAYRAEVIQPEVELTEDIFCESNQGERVKISLKHDWREGLGVKERSFGSRGEILKCSTSKGEHLRVVLKDNWRETGSLTPLEMRLLVSQSE